jgi:hypothetical protein
MPIILEGGDWEDCNLSRAGKGVLGPHLNLLLKVGMVVCAFHPTYAGSINKKD